MPADNPPRWITIRKVPYDYRFKDRSAMICYSEPGEYMVKGEVADDAVVKGYASEGKADGSEAKSRKGKSPRKRKAVKLAPDAATDTGSNDSLGGSDLAAHDSASAGQPLAGSAG